MFLVAAMLQPSKLKILSRCCHELAENCITIVEELKGRTSMFLGALSISVEKEFNIMKRSHL